ncbi:hypothetical protein PVAP13_9NG809466 [Panicum virgatum]|uniref:Uncharacterized protein n=1 Tax=Panicum virgatum TaxID=38727 RepID=A0A8T0NAV4_PANVG|nr:hypothetical protein PVAP13_9NG809466 [Panicum virgatum]
MDTLDANSAEASISPSTPSSGNSLHSDSPLVSAADEPSVEEGPSPPRRPTTSRSNFSLMERTTEAVPSPSSTKSWSTSSSLASSRPPMPTQLRSLKRTTVSETAPASAIRDAYASASRSSAPPRKMATEQGAYCSTARLAARTAALAVLRAPSEDLWKGSRTRRKAFTMRSDGEGLLVALRWRCGLSTETARPTSSRQASTRRSPPSCCSSSSRLMSGVETAVMSTMESCLGFRARTAPARTTAPPPPPPPPPPSLSSPGSVRYPDSAMYTGRNSAMKKESSRSVMVAPMGMPPGSASPSIMGPIMYLNPMASVASADSSAPITTTTKEPSGLREERPRRGAPSTKPTKEARILAVKAGDVASVTRMKAAEQARMNQETTSVMRKAVSAMRPRSVLRRSRSESASAMTGKEESERRTASSETSDVPRRSSGSDGRSAWKTGSVTASGTRAPVSATASARPLGRRRRPRSVLTPMEKRKRMSATRETLSRM